MKLITWIEINGIKPSALAKKLKISQVHVHKYLYEEVIPRPAIMKRIYELTCGAVTPNSFYSFV